MNEKVTVAKADIEALISALQSYINGVDAALRPIGLIRGLTDHLGAAVQKFQGALTPVEEKPPDNAA
jgi:hypothetical protein